MNAIKITKTLSILVVFLLVSCLEDTSQQTQKSLCQNGYIEKMVYSPNGYTKYDSVDQLIASSDTDVVYKYYASEYSIQNRFQIRCFMDYKDFFNVYTLGTVDTQVVSGDTVFHRDLPTYGNSTLKIAVNEDSIHYSIFYSNVGFSSFSCQIKERINSRVDCLTDAMTSCWTVWEEWYFEKSFIMHTYTQAGAVNLIAKLDLTEENYTEEQCKDSK